MGARSGNNYLSTLKKLGAEVWFDGVRVPNVTSHEILASRARTIASLYDLQMEKPEAMTFRTDDGGRAGMSFIQPRSADEVRKRGRMMKIWADYNCGMLRDTPDVTNVTVAAMSATRELLAESDRRYRENIESYYREACKHDWCICFALQGPDVLGVSPQASSSGQWLKIIEQTSEGIVVGGPCYARSLLPLCEELLVLPGMGARDPGIAPYVSMFAISSNTKGLKLLVKNSPPNAMDLDCAVLFEDVLVPWQRVFSFRVREENRNTPGTPAVSASIVHQTAVRNLASGEFAVGLGVLVAEAANLISDDAVRAEVVDMTTTVEMMRAQVQRAEAEAVADRWGIFAPNPDAFDQVITQASRLESQLVDIVRRANPSAAARIAAAGEAGGGGYREIAMDVARNSTSNSADGSAYPASLKPIIERAREFIARRG